MHTSKVGLRPTKSWVHVRLEKKEKEERVLKYFHVKNGNIFFMELKKKNECILDINFH